MRRFAIAFIVALAPQAAVWAQGYAGTQQEQQACSRDASRFCRRELGDDTAVQHCLQQHRHRLTAACRRVFESHGR
ncbi:MAG: cysteine rich repeat-containing protein [Gemmatimonas sp.]|jgi:hypothetical protein